MVYPRDDRRTPIVTNVETTIREYIVELLGPDAPRDLDPATHLLEQNLLDSIGIYEVVVFLEQRFGIDVLDDEVIPENFGSIHLLARLVEAKR